MIATGAALESQQERKGGQEGPGILRNDTAVHGAACPHRDLVDPIIQTNQQVGELGSTPVLGQSSNRCLAHISIGMEAGDTRDGDRVPDQL
jgi:hypothetical protein